MNVLKTFVFLIALSASVPAFSDNQTPDVSPISQSEKGLPFRVRIEKADFSLPNGLHSGASACYKGKWLFIAGRTNGMHGFNNDPDNFPPQEQNTTVYVVDPHKKTVKSRSLTSSHSGLTQAQIDTLSVTAPQYRQSGKTLYVVGGYGVDTATGLFSTKSVLTAIDIPGLIHWVTNPSHKETAAKHIRQLSNPIFQVTGGFMGKIGNHANLLIFGQNFTGFYGFGPFTQEYTEQVRRFRIVDNGKKLGVIVKSSKPSTQDPNYRRRDLNVVPIISKDKHGKLVQSFLALSGVFTLTDGAWTVPVKIAANGKSSMADPSNPQTFKQGMNNYFSAKMGLFSEKRSDMYTLLLGGISFGYFSNGQFLTDPELPFINQLTTIKINKHGKYKQFLMSNQYPTILSTQSNPGNQLLFGAAAYFMLAGDVDTYDNQVIKFDALKKRTVVGYIVGGIQSTLPNTNVITDSAASPYIFKVIIEPWD